MEEHALLQRIMAEKSSHFAPLPPPIKPYQPNSILISPMNLIILNIIILNLIPFSPNHTPSTNVKIPDMKEAK